MGEWDPPVKLSGALMETWFPPGGVGGPLGFPRGRPQPFFGPPVHMNPTPKMPFMKRRSPGSQGVGYNVGGKMYPRGLTNF